MAKRPAYSKLNIGELIDLDINDLTKRQLRTVERRLRETTERRLGVIEKHGYTSYAAERYFDKGKLPERSLVTDTINAVRHKVAVLQHFLQSKSSSYTGLKRVFKAEEQRIFGVNKGFSNDAQRQRFWQAYMEFMNQNPRYYDQSTRVQQFLGQSTFWKYREFNADDLSNLANQMLNNATRGVDIRVQTGYNPEI